MMKRFQDYHVGTWIVQASGRRRPRRVLTVMARSLLVASIAMAFVLKASTSSRSIPTPTKPVVAATVVRPTPPLARNTKPQGAPLEGELITLRPYGFEPAEITRPAGPFVLVIENYSQMIGGVDLQLSANSGVLAPGTVPPKLAIPQGKPQLDNVFNLAPGQYVLTEANHPEWVCTITIVSQ